MTHQNARNSGPANPFTDFPALLARLAWLDETAERTRAAWYEALTGCRHETYRLVVVLCRNGVSQFKSECQVCGRRSGAIAYRSLQHRLRDEAGEPDDTISERWRASHERALLLSQGYADEARTIR